MKHNLDKKKVIAIVVVISIIAIIFLLSLPKNCGTDDSCFNIKTNTCSKAKVITYNNNNQYTYEVLGKRTDNCIIEVKLISLSDTQPAEIKQALEGKSMTCTISRSLLQTQTIKEVENLNDVCSGQLKEATLQITIDKMYEIIVKNIGPIAAEFQRELNNN